MTYETLLTILAMALTTYLTRAGGVWAMARLAPTPRLTTWLKRLPQAILISLTAPVILSNGPAEALAGVTTVFVAARTQNLLLSIVTGVATVWALRLAL